MRPGPDRTQASCPLYEACGGCQLQHLSLEAQRQAKRAIVREAMRRIGALGVAVPPVVSAGSGLGYRNRVRFVLRRSGGDVEAGYRHLADAGRIVDVPDCPLAEPAVREAWRALRQAWGRNAEALPAGSELRITLRGTSDGAVGILVEGGAGTGDGERPIGHPDRVAAEVPGLRSYSWQPTAGRRRLLAGHATLTDRWQGVDFELGAGVFLQVNREASAAMDRYLDGLVGDRPGLLIADLYSGAGARAIRWAAEGAIVVACEVKEESCAAGRAAARGLDVHVAYDRGRVEDRIGELRPADLIVVNPPRRGLSRKVVGGLRRREAQALAYVSCDPATLARDLNRLRESWRTVSIQPFDAFPQTSHVECVAWLERRRSPVKGSAGSGPA
jgi:23S rRNA (uracil1939-C5)-methyltransferase